MANENKNIKELVSDDDDPTAELEIPGFRQLDEIEVFQADNESDAHTYGLGDPDVAPTSRGQTIPELQSDLQSRTKTIGQLQYDIQQLRAKWLGLETEISAREEIVGNLQGDVEKLNKRIARKDRLLKKHTATIRSLKSDIRKQKGEQRALEDRLTAQEQASVDDARARDAALAELQSVRTELEAAYTTLKDSEDARRERDDAYADLEQRFGDLQQQGVEQSALLEGAEREIERLQRELESAEQEERSLNSEMNRRDELESELELTNADLRRQLESLHSTETDLAEQLEAATQQAAQLRGELDAARHQSTEKIVQTQKTTSSVVRELHAQLAKTEQYADTLRFKLKDSDEALSAISKQGENLSRELAGQMQQNSDLCGELDSTRAANEELRASLERTHAEHEQEIRTLRFELTEAQDSVAQTGDLNSQLASDLMSTRGFKEELERMLLGNEEDAQQRIAELEKKVEQLSDTAEEFEQKLETKDSAINVLLAELAKKTEQIESISEIEDVIHEIDNRMSEKFDEPGKEIEQKSTPGGERDRITRVLVGSIGEQELRFPLFKNRLTIGRTADNDIQLKTSYISRRHAVVLTEGDATRVIDWGSKNGVYVNGERVKEQFLSNGDIVAVGNAKFRYEERPKR